MNASARFLATADPTPSPEEQFLLLGRQFVEEWARAGVSIVLTRSPSLPQFRGAGRKVQHAALSYLSFNLSILREMNAAGEDPKNDRRYLWRALTKLRLVPPSDFMNVLENEDVIQIYYLDEIQVFRNARFLEITSYSVEDLLCRPGFQLAKRGWKPLLQMFRLVVKFKLGLIRNATPWQIPEHTIRELNTAENREFSILLKYLIPLRHEGRNVAALISSRARVLSRGSEERHVP